MNYNNLIFNIPYNKMILIDENVITKQRVYFEKSRFTQANIDQYFIKIFKITPTGSYLCQGYIYFHLDFLMKSSNFIGIYVMPELRNLGLAQLLISYWISLCLDNGIFDLKTIPKQRKPFVLYLLKKFRFDLQDMSKYQTCPNIINICQEEFTNGKCLYFANHRQAETFKHSTINYGDNYVILDQLSPSTIILDKVILSNPYEATDEYVMSTKAYKLIHRFNDK